MSGSRILWLDTVRALAIISVVACHSGEAIYSYNLEFMSGIDMLSRLFAFSCLTFGRIGVPLFLFLTGFLLLNRDWNRHSCIKFWKTRWLPLFLCVEAWIVIYFLFLWAIGRPFSIGKLASAMLLVGSVDMGHFWYMPMIVGFYLFLPIMGAALKQLDPRTIAFPLTIVAIFCFAVPIATQLFAVFDIPVELSIKADMGFSGGTYGVYIILGWCAKRGAFDKTPVVALSVSIVLLFVACVAFQYACYQNNVKYNIWYNNGLLLLCGLALFILMSHMPEKWFTTPNSLNSSSEGKRSSSNLSPLGRVSFCLSYYSFAIYLVHYPIRILIMPYFSQLPISPPLQTVSLCITTLLVSLALCWAISKIPYFGKRLLYLK